MKLDVTLFSELAELTRESGLNSQHALELFVVIDGSLLIELPHHRASYYQRQTGAQQPGPQCPSIRLLFNSIGVLV